MYYFYSITRIHVTEQADLINHLKNVLPQERDKNRKGIIGPNKNEQRIKIMLLLIMKK